MADDNFETQEEVVLAFEALRAKRDKMEGAGFAAEAVPHLRKIERSVQVLGLFSPNEEFDELDVELQPILLLPYFVALTEGAAREDRLSALARCEHYLRIFLNLCRHYGLLPATAAKIFSAFQKPDFKLSREDKIALYREEKSAEEQGGKLAAAGATAAINRNLVTECAVKAMNKLLLVPQERQMLEYGARLATDTNAREEYERYRAQPLPKPTFFRMEKPADADAEPQDPPPLVVESFEQKTANERQQKLEALRRDGRVGAKMEILAKMNQPSHAQPTMTLDQFDQLEYDLLQNKEREAREMQAQKDEFKRKMGIDDSEDSENELVADMKTYKAREWDDFKDENEKGSGNRYGK